MTANTRTGLRTLVRACGMSAAILTLPAISQGAATIAIQNGTPPAWASTIRRRRRLSAATPALPAASSA